MSSELLKKAKENLVRYWGYETFRPGQDEAIRSVLEGEDTLVLFPTGGGKSLCYQIPATVREGLTLVISPLVALMQDQVSRLTDLGISASFVNSSLSGWEVEQRFANARNGMYKLFYCAPERLKTDLFKSELEQLGISLVAIDEAHCISEWGHDFRPSYREIRPLLEPVADKAAWIALTATATPEVREDIIKNLEFSKPRVVSRGYDRPNLKWWVTGGEKKEEKLMQSVGRAARKGQGLIYAGTRRNCEELSRRMGKELGIEARAYHAGIDNEERKAIQRDWQSGDLPVVVATNAFGMGIDKPDCRYVIHYEMPYSLEAYYQEAGRAGRDGEESFAILLFRPSDSKKAERRIKDAYPEKARLQNVYDALCDELGLAVGSETKHAEPVSIDAVRKRSGMSEHSVRASLRVLDQRGIIQMFENVLPRISLRFNVSEERVFELIEKNPNKEKAAFLDTLFRQYGQGAFLEMKSLDMSYLQRKLDTTRNGLIKGLQVLQNNDHLLSFEAVGERPLIQLTAERVRALPFGKKELERHRNTLLQKLEQMLGYIETRGCREVYLRIYFGEQDVEPCGHCDNCLGVHEEEPEDLSLDTIQLLRDVLEKEGKDIRELQKDTGLKKSVLRETLSLLIREEKVGSDGERYFWKG